MIQSSSLSNHLRGAIGAIAGGGLGYLAFVWILGQGFYALLLPPGLLGLGAGIGIRHRSMPFAIACGVAGLGLGLFTEWHFFPFNADNRFFFFLAHLHKLRPLTMIMLALSPIISYRLALGVDVKQRPAPDSK